MVPLTCRPRWRPLPALFFLAFAGWAGWGPPTATAQSLGSIPATYQVQVKYWYWDSDYEYWSTVLETDSRTEAQFVYDLLRWAHEQGELNTVAPHTHWRFIAVDVQMTTHYLLYESLDQQPYRWRPTWGR